MMASDPTRCDWRSLGDPPSQRELIAALEGAGEPPLSLAGGEGEAILVLPHGGRVLGLYSSKSERNFLWTNATIRSMELARQHFASDVWRNTGGDRIWLAPEIDFFYPHYPDTAREYLQPRALDPGEYSVVAAGSAITLENNLSIRSFRRRWTAQATITQTVSATTNPLRRHATADLADRLQFAGYRLHTRLEVKQVDAEHFELGLWRLLQLPPGGEMLLPVYRPTSPTVYFGDIPAGDLSSDNHCVRYRMSAAGEQKIGVEALAVAGRAGYYLADSAAGEATLVVRNFAVDPGGAYVDAPLHSPDSDGHAFQACNIDADCLGRFAELEYHVPAIASVSPGRWCDDISQVWAYRGRPRDVAAAARAILGVQI